MICSLVGLSPSDLILQGVDSRVIKMLLQMLNNRFDIEVLQQVKLEIEHTVSVIDNMVFDYENREDRVLSKKLSVANMTAFGSQEDRKQAEEKLASASKIFTGNMNIDGRIISIGSGKAKEILMQLHAEKLRLVQIRNTIFYKTFSDDIFFGRPLTWWANSRTHAWLSKYAAERIERQDNVVNLLRDAERLLLYVENDDDGAETIQVELPKTEEVIARYAQLSGNMEPTVEEHELMDRFIDVLAVRNLTAIGQEAVSALISVFVYCLLASKQHDPEAAEKLEQCGLYFMNPVRAEYMLTSLSDLTLVPERGISLKNLKQGDSYEVILGAIIAACKNDMTPIGAKLEGNK